MVTSRWWFGGKPSEYTNACWYAEVFEDALLNCVQKLSACPFSQWHSITPATNKMNAVHAYGHMRDLLRTDCVGMYIVGWFLSSRSTLWLCAAEQEYQCISAQICQRSSALWGIGAKAAYVSICWVFYVSSSDWSFCLTIACSCLRKLAIWGEYIKSDTCFQRILLYHSLKPSFVSDMPFENSLSKANFSVFLIIRCYIMYFMVVSCCTPSYR